MKIGGFQKVSLIDFPGKISSIIFTQGCMFRCRYCHNPELVDPILFGEEIESDFILEYLERRKGKIEGVVITGGEPTIHPELISLIRRIKELGYAVKLDTTGYIPGAIKRLLKENLLDYIAMDIKAPLHAYSKINKRVTYAERLKESIAIIMDSEIAYEFRTTVVKELLSPDELLEIVSSIKGAQKYVLQGFRNTKTLDESMKSAHSYSPEELEHLSVSLSEYVKRIEVRV